MVEPLGVPHDPWHRIVNVNWLPDLAFVSVNAGAFVPVPISGQTESCQPGIPFTPPEDGYSPVYVNVIAYGYAGGGGQHPTIKGGEFGLNNRFRRWLPSSMGTFEDNPDYMDKYSYEIISESYPAKPGADEIPVPPFLIGPYNVLITTSGPKVLFGLGSFSTVNRSTTGPIPKKLKDSLHKELRTTNWRVPGSTTIGVWHRAQSAGFFCVGDEFSAFRTTAWNGPMIESLTETWSSHQVAITVRDRAGNPKVYRPIAMTLAAPPSADQGFIEGNSGPTFLMKPDPRD